MGFDPTSSVASRLTHSYGACSLSIFLGMCMPVTLPKHTRPAALIVAGVFVILLLVLPVRAEAERLPAGDAIVQAALPHIGTHGGQCWTFARRVIEEATGLSLGFDYREGYFEAGAVEVTLEEAIAGDIIQIADDSHTGMSADYPGLHTAIVLENFGDGIFTVIDSNSQWDEMVRIRENYDPRAAAARYPGVTARVYRFTGDGTAAPASAGSRQAAPQPSPVGVGDTARVAANGDCLNLRTAAGTGSQVITCLGDGSRLRVLSEPVTAGVLSWVEVETAEGQRGWVATTYLALVDAPAPATSAGDVTPVMQFRTFAPALSSQ